MWIRVAAAVAVITVSLPAQLYAQQAGQAVSIKQTAGVSGAVGGHVLQTNDPVFMGDVVNTNNVGVAQLRLMDDTRLVVGPNSQMEIDSFVFARQSTARDVTINAVQGTLRFITGQSQKQAYTINTPVTSIGVRGTELDVTVNGNNIAMALYGGGVRMCDYSRPRRCVDLDEACGVITFNPQQGYQWERNVFEKTRMMDTVFPYGFRQNLLQAGFRVDSRSCEYRDTAPGRTPSGQPANQLPTGGGNGGGGGGGGDIPQIE